MTAAHAEAPAQLSHAEARVLTDDIKRSVERTWGQLTEAYQGKAWAALGFTTWESYVQTELGISRSRSYQLLDQAKVVREIQAAASVHIVDITEAAARDLKPHLAEVVEQVREAVADVPEPDRPAVVAEVIRDVRDQVITDRRTGEVTPSAPPAAASAPAPAPDPAPAEPWSPSAVLDNPPPRPPSSRPAAKPSKPATFEQDFATAALALHKAANQVERLSGDPRFAPRMGKLDAKHRSFIVDAVEGLNIVLTRLRPVKS